MEVEWIAIGWKTWCCAVWKLSQLLLWWQILWAMEWRDLGRDVLSSQDRDRSRELRYIKNAALLEYRNAMIEDDDMIKIR